MEKQRLFVDMDGTLAVFQKVDTLEALYEQGYFLDLPPIENVLNSVKTIIQNNPGIEVNVLSAVIADSEFALSEKNAWLDKYLPEIDNSRRIFTRCGEDKKDFIPSGIRPNDFLLDDYTNNLTLWQPPARGIKLLNGINHTNGTWQHDCLRFDKPANELAENIVSIMQGGERIIDRRPEIKEVNFIPHAKEEEKLTGIPKHIKLEGRTNRWSAVDEKVIDDKTFYLMENDVYGDETDFVIIDQNKNIICEDVYNGFEETAFVELYPPAPEPIPLTSVQQKAEYLMTRVNLENYMLKQNIEKIPESFRISAQNEMDKCVDIADDIKHMLDNNMLSEKQINGLLSDKELMKSLSSFFEYYGKSANIHEVVKYCADLRISQSIENLFNLPNNQGYYIFDQNKNYAFAMSPTAPSRYVLWERDQDCSYFGGKYSNRLDGYDFSYTGLDIAEIKQRIELSKTQFEDCIISSPKHTSQTFADCSRFKSIPQLKKDKPISANKPIVKPIEENKPITPFYRRDIAIEP